MTDKTEKIMFTLLGIGLDIVLTLTLFAMHSRGKGYQNFHAVRAYHAHVHPVSVASDCACMADKKDTTHRMSKKHVCHADLLCQS